MTLISIRMEENSDLNITDFKKRLFLHWAVLILLLSVFAGCSEKEVAPYSDNLFLRYSILIYGPMGMRNKAEIGIHFKEVEPGYFRITLAQNDTSFLKYEMEGDILVNQYGKLGNGNDLTLTPDQAPVWAPVYKMKKGKKIGDARLQERKQWKDWEVWAARLPVPGGTGFWYFEENTGFLVGADISHMGAGMQTVLIETNADGL
jgi:hypothetical protein